MYLGTNILKLRASPGSEWSSDINNRIILTNMGLGLRLAKKSAREEGGGGWIFFAPSHYSYGGGGKKLRGGREKMRM